MTKNTKILADIGKVCYDEKENVMKMLGGVQTCQMILKTRMTV